RYRERAAERANEALRREGLRLEQPSERQPEPPHRLGAPRVETEPVRRGEEGDADPGRGVCLGQAERERRGDAGDEQPDTHEIGQAAVTEGERARGAAPAFWPLCRHHG